MKKLFLLSSFILLFLFSCARAPVNRIEDAMRPAKEKPEIVDSLSRESFFMTLKKHIDVMKRSRQVMDPMIFGKRKIAKSDYINALSKILERGDDWVDYIRHNFEPYEVYGREDWSEIMSTGYYEPKVYGSREPSEQFSQAVYSTPKDLVTVNLKNFAKRFPDLGNRGMMIGRLTSGNNLYPYLTRKEIDSDLKLQGQNLEIAWMDPLDSFFIQIQGSGVVEFPNGDTLRIGYDGQNGHSYEAIGKHLTHAIPMEKMSMQKIKSHLKTLPRESMQEILNLNPSYIFFKILKSDALTYAGMEVSEGRTIATDLRLFPKGALAFMDIEEPVFLNETADEPVSWVRKPRLVFDQDTGGAIKGTGRVDLFMGSGAQAAQKAGVMKQPGRLFYLVPRL